ncbi:type III PLP-dependent enzyme [Paenibacillus puldeungensis]|uniref:Type III PLP-dependent enzyme n=1 Tax=Paenibacillus puldeungensis TaxID=696536 RepID=A0ABW3RU32_9BACL
MKPKVWEAIHQLQTKSREPVCAYVYDLDGIQKNVREMQQTMPSWARLFYAIKANPDPRVIESLLPLVDGFEVASIGELLKVREISDSIQILFGGPGKRESELEMAIQHNVTYIHVESLLELRRMIWLARDRIDPVKILLRINLRADTLPQTKITMGGRPTPFGLDEQLIGQAIAMIRNEGQGAVRLCGFHFHSLSNNLDAKLHAEMIELYLQKVAEWAARYDLEIEVINAGGGFGVSYNEAPEFDWPLFTSLIAQSDAIKRLAGMNLLFEPGRFIVADHGYYAAEVIDIKTSHQQQFAVLRGGTHHNRLPASWGHNHPFVIMPTDRWTYPFDRPEVRHGKVTIVGELCTPKDRLHTDAEVERLCVGDIVIFEKSGAYCWTISHHDFLGHPHPEFYYLTGGKEHAAIDDTVRSAVGQAADQC